MSRLVRSMMLVLVLLLALALPAHAAKSYSADRFDVDIVVQSDGSARITESVAFH